MSFLSVAGVSKRQQDAFVVKEVTFEQEQAQKIAIAGETGSGKSTLLKIIAGLVQRDTGRVLFKNKPVAGPEEKLMPGHKGIAYLSQYFELHNNYRVEELLEYANELPAVEAHTLYEVCRIDHLLKRRTDQLSGGEKQRIALARLLTSAPALLLLDEPYSNLDAIHKNMLKQVIRDIGEKLNISCLLVSHDAMDTLSWADQILIMKDGKLVQQGTPEQIYRRPVSAYTAALFGTFNLVSPALARAFLGPRAHPEESLFVRPERFKIVPEGRGAIRGRVVRVQFFGPAYEATIQMMQENIIVRTNRDDLKPHAVVHVTLLADGVW